MEKQSSEKRFALLIDADNVSAKYIKPITDELSNYGTVTIKRIYGDWTLSLHAKWKDALLENSLTPIQQFGYTQGKNATDSAMIIDAMDILYTGSVEGFCIVSSDSDFTRLASRLRESGRMVIGMGEKKTPTPFRRACDVFTTLELLLDDAGGKRKGKGEAGSGPSIEEVEQAVVRIITDNQNNGKATGLGEVGSRLLKRFPDFDVRSYGTNLLSKLLGKFASVTITKRGSDVSVELADDKEPARDAAREERKERRDEPARPESQKRPDRSEEEDGEPSSEAEGEGGAASEEAQSSSSRRRRRRRNGTRASRRRGTEGEENGGSGPIEGDAKSKPDEDAAPAKSGTQGDETDRGASGMPEKPAPSSEAPASSFASDLAEVNATTRRLVAEAGPAGMEMSQLAAQVRAAHRDFKVRDHGHAQFKSYVASLGDIEVERIGKEWFARMGE